MKERCRDGCRTSLLIAGVVLVPAIFHTSLPPCHPYITIHFMEMIFSTCYNTSQFFEGATDYEPLPAITVLNSADVWLFPVSDRIALEYNDKILLKFTPSISLLVSVLEGIGEYIRDTATVNITDSDCKKKYVTKLELCMLSFIHVSRR